MLNAGQNKYLKQNGEVLAPVAREDLPSGGGRARLPLAQTNHGELLNSTEELLGFEREGAGGGE